MLQTEAKMAIKIFPPQNVDGIISTVLVASGSLLQCFLYSILMSSSVAGKWNSEVWTEVLSGKYQKIKYQK